MRADIAQRQVERGLQWDDVPGCLASSDPPCNGAVEPVASLAGSASTASSPFSCLGRCRPPTPPVWRSRRDGGRVVHRLLAWARTLIRVDGFPVKVFPEREDDVVPGPFEPPPQHVEDHRAARMPDVRRCVDGVVTQVHRNLGRLDRLEAAYATGSRVVQAAAHAPLVACSAGEARRGGFNAHVPARLCATRGMPGRERRHIRDGH